MVNDLKKQLDKLEKYLFSRIYINFSQLPGYIEKPIIKYLPLISIILGLLCVLSAYNLWHAAHNLNALVNYANSYSNLYGVPKVPVDHHMGLAFWLAIIALLSEAYLFFKAASLVSKQRLAGWSLMYYALVINVVYAVILLFSYFGGIGTLLERLIFSFICLYFLFEIKDSFTSPHARKKTSKAKKS